MKRLTLWMLGTQVLSIELGSPETADDDDRGTCTTYPIGFTPPPIAPYEYDTPDRDW